MVTALVILNLCTALIAVVALWVLGTELRETRRERQILLESLGRRLETPLIFSRPEPEPTVGWFDRKPEIMVKR